MNEMNEMDEMESVGVASPSICDECGHAEELHRATGCDGNLSAEQAYWRSFESLPGYDQTREAIDGLERAEPRPCPCPMHLRRS